jgi:hypothetical protein
VEIEVASSSEIRDRSPSGIPRIYSSKFRFVSHIALPVKGNDMKTREVGTHEDNTRQMTYNAWHRFVTSVQFIEF